MNVNSEAIYGTRAIKPFKEGKVCISKKGNNTIYIYCLAADNEIMPLQIGMTTCSLPAGAKVKMIGTGTSLNWQKKENGFLITIPEKLRNNPPSEYVWVLKATL